MSSVGYSLLAAWSAAIVMLGVTTPPKSISAAVFRQPALRGLGHYAYGLYVIHHILLFFIPKSFHPPSWPNGIVGSALPKLALFSALMTLLSVAIAMVSWRFLESPFLSLKRYFVTRADRPIATHQLAFRPFPPSNPVTKPRIAFKFPRRASRKRTREPM